MARRKKRQQRLDRTVAHIQHKWGQQAIQKGRRRPARMPVIATGFAELDAALGIGGIPKGRITTLSGAPTSGKVTLAALILSKAQARGRHPVAYIDLAHTCDADYLERCGVQLKNLLVVRPKESYQALDLTLTLAGRSELAAILFDHWGALQDDRETQRYAAGTLDHLAGRLARSKTTLIALDDALPLWRRLLPGSERALAHYASLHLNLNRERWLLSGPDVRGYKARVTIEKNKLGPSGHTIPIEIHFNGTVKGRGI
ncbi:MAG: hypothetical protein GY759_18970 [Chloroflexi bacterium]|nr:hypothetical protein [Chloroflexota bacterium]